MKRRLVTRLSGFAPLAVSALVLLAAPAAVPAADEGGSAVAGVQEAEAAAAEEREAAAEEGAAEESHLFWNAINLAILIGVIVYYGRKPLQRYFGERRREVSHDIDRSAELLAESESRLAEWQGRIDRLDAELDEIRRTARRRAEAERDRILEQAQAAAERIRRDAESAIERELRRAHDHLRDEAVALTVDLAAKLMREQVTEEDRERLLGEFIDGVDGAAAPGGRPE